MLFRQPLRLIILLSVFCVSEDASAQLFGARTVGRNSTPAAQADAGIVRGFERFIRGNRSADSFVGAGNAAASAFAGGSQATGAAGTTSSVVGLTEEAAPPVNRPRRRKTAGIYLERLSVGFEPRSGTDAIAPRSADVSERLSELAAKRDLTITVSPDRAATVRGTVASDHQKRIAELLVLFEPGIETVTNELRVSPTSAR